MDNKKVKNAKQTEEGGISFKSVLESTVYKILKENGFEPEYEPKKFILFDGYSPKTTLITKLGKRKPNKKLDFVGNGVIKDMRHQQPITYTPDFIFTYNNKMIVVEAKGFKNDVYPYKIKMFRKYIDDNYEQGTVEIWEIFSKKQLLQCINHLKLSQ